jgi:hypothetical protein
MLNPATAKCTKCKKDFRADVCGVPMFRYCAYENESEVAGADRICLREKGHQKRMGMNFAEHMTIKYTDRDPGMWTDDNTRQDIKIWLDEEWGLKGAWRKGSIGGHSVLLLRITKEAFKRIFNHYMVDGRIRTFFPGTFEYSEGDKFELVVGFHHQQRYLAQNGVIVDALIPLNPHRAAAINTLVWARIACPRAIEQYQAEYIAAMLHRAPYLRKKADARISEVMERLIKDRALYIAGKINDHRNGKSGPTCQHYITDVFDAGHTGILGVMIEGGKPITIKASQMAWADHVSLGSPFWDRVHFYNLEGEMEFCVMDRRSFEEVAEWR